MIAPDAGHHSTGQAHSVESLVAAAVNGDEDAWGALVTRYTPLVWGVVHGLGLNRADGADINQTVWLRLVEHLHRLREPAALPKWIVTTARRECLRVLKTGRQESAYDPLGHTAYWSGEGSGQVPETAPDEQLLLAERRQALRDAFAQLPRHCQRLLALLLNEPPLRYGEISARTGMAVGSIGPTRGRCLDRLRRCPALEAYTGSARAPESGRDDRHGAAAVGS